MLACSRGTIECCKALVSRGAAIDQTDKSGANALFHACRGLSTEDERLGACVKYLLDGGSDYAISINTGGYHLTALELSCKNGLPTCMGCLLDVTISNLGPNTEDIGSKRYRLDASPIAKLCRRLILCACRGNPAAVEGCAKCIQLLSRYDGFDITYRYRSFPLTLQH
jgi:hypothetical protein